MENVQLVDEGMFLDSDPSIQPPNTYRYGLNGNLITMNGRNFSFETTDGTVLSWTMPLHKVGTPVFIPIGFIRMGDKLIVHSTDNKTTGGDGEIGIVTFNNAGVGSYNVLYYHADLNYTLAHMIFGYGLEENNNFHRQYYTDDFNQGRTMNTANPVFTTNFATGSLVVGNSYMVLTNSIGSITHNAVVYGPKQAAGNVFVAVNANYTTAGSVRVIELVDPNIFNYTPNKAMGTIDFVRYNFGGNIWCGVKLYAYQLSTKEGYESSWTFTTNPIHITSFNPTGGYQAYQGQGAGAVLVNSGKSIDLIINDIPQEFDKIKVAVIEVDQAYETARSITVFYNEDITGTSMTVTHLGNEDLEELILEDLSLTNATVIRFKDITTTKQRQIISNLTARPEIDFDPSGATVTPLVYTMPTDTYLDASDAGTPTATLSPGNTTWNHGMCASTGIALTGILTGGHYVVRGTGTITYNAVVYAVGEIFVGVSGQTTFAVTSLAPIVKGCIRIQKYINNASDPVYQIIDLEDEFFDYKSMASQMYLKGRFRDETYRDAILAWDNFGNPYFVRWMNDTVMPSQSDASGLYGLLGRDTTSYKQYYAQVLGITVSGIDITSLVGKITGISVVRVKRDKTILGQGIVWQNVKGAVDGLHTVPLSTVSPADDYNVNQQTPDSTLGYTWGTMGPEFDFDNTNVFPIRLQEGDRFTPVADLDAVFCANSAFPNGGQPFSMVNLGEEIYSKFYIHNRYTISGHSTSDEEIQIAFSSGMGTNFAYGSGGRVFYNKEIVTGVGHPPGPSDVLASTALQTKGAEGGERTIIINNVEDYINGQTATGTGVNTNGILSTRKLLANYVRPKSVLYGGSSDQAKANSQYQFCGHYLKIDAALLADIDDGAGNYILDGMEVFGGDCFVGLYDRVTSVYDDVEYASGRDIGSGVTVDGSYSYGFIFPVESEINVALREGKHMALNGMHAESAGVLYRRSGQVGPLEDIKLYNFAYSTENDFIPYDSLPIDYNGVERFPYMHRYSEFKNLGEKVDNMRKFLIANHRNVDAMHGEITNVMVADGKLFYIQRRGIGYIPIEERETAIGALGQAVQIGVGGVAQRYDTIDKFYGCQHQSSLVVLPDRFLFYDMHRKSIVSFAFSGRVEDSSVVNGVHSFFQNAFEAAESLSSSILNLDQPLLGNGVIGVFDPMTKTAYMTFKFSETDGRSGLIPLDFTIGVLAAKTKFVGFFSFTPMLYTEINSRVYAVNSVRNAISISTVYTIGSTVSKNGIAYVCVYALTTGVSIAANEQPDYVGSVYWVATSIENQVHRMFKGDVAKYFGIVYPYQLEFVSNKNLTDEKVYDNCEVYGNDTPFTDVYYEGSRQTASDVNITAKNKNFNYIDNSWWFNTALHNSKERLVDHYMKVKLVVKNYLTNPTISLNTTKRIVYLRTIFRKKL